MGCPGATIVFEELIQLGCKKLIRVGTCGGLQPHHQLGDLIVALTAVPADSTAMHLVGNEPHCPTASWSIIHGAVHTAKELGQELARRADRLERRLLQPGRGPVRALVEARRARGRDGGIGALHGRRAPRRRDGLPADRQRHRRRGRVHAHLGRRPPRGRRPHDADRARRRHLANDADASFASSRPSSSSTRRPGTAPPESAGPSWRGGRRLWGSRATRSSPSGPAT